MLKTILIDKSYYTERGQKVFNALFGTKTKLFQSPKSPYLIAQLAQTITSGTDLILDFFGGSGTTGHAVMMQNQLDGGKRRYMLVQLDEPLDPDNKDQKATADYLSKIKKPLKISELTKERLRKAASAIKSEFPLFVGDLGFRVYKLDSSNIREWDPNRDDMAATLEEHAEHLKTDRTENDILTELLLKLGLDLCLPIQKRTISETAVYSVGDGVLFACLPKSITRAQVKPLAQGILAWREELKVAVKSEFVFRDSAFADDVAKTNLAAYIEQNLPESQRGRIRSL